METQIYHNSMRTVRIEFSNNKALLIKVVKDKNGVSRIGLIKMKGLDHPTMSVKDVSTLGQGEIVDVQIMDDEEMDFIHHNNGAKREVQLPLFPNAITSSLKNE